jgi:putative heme-binding domain-containing protein
VLVEARTSWLSPDLRWLLDDPALRGPAIRALAAYEDDETPPALLKRFGAFDADQRADAIATLAARPTTARALLDAVAAGTIPRRDLSATVARQLLALRDGGLSRRLEEVWGAIRPTSGAKASLMAKYKALLTADALKSADPSRGRAVFNRTCLQCHRLYDSGGDVGPDLTGSDRANLDYILENVLDPSAAVGRDYRLTTIATSDGRILEGIIREQSSASVTIQTANERVILPREDVEEMKVSDASMMPEGLFEKLSEEEVRDLVSYLASKAQVPLPNEAGQ